MTHNYPKTRKPRNTDYARSTQIIKAFGLDEIESIWKEHGMYKTAKILAQRLDTVISPYVIRYLSCKYDWKRTVSDTALPIYRGVLKGSVPAGYYKHINFTKENILDEYHNRI